MTAATQAPSRLGNVLKGRTGGPRRFCFYGVESVGKTTLAAHSPEPIFIDIENGSSELDVARYVFDSGLVVPSTWEDFLAAIDDLTNNEHAFKTLVVDSIDRLESLIWEYVRKRDSGVKSELNKTGRNLVSIESYGYGKGYNVALDEFKVLLSKLERLRNKRQLNIIFIGHAHVKMFKNPSGEDYDRYWLRAHPGIAGQLKEWVDVVGFCCFEEFADKLEGSEKKAPVGISTGVRFVNFEREAAFDAKSRIPLPRKIQLLSDNPWAPLQAAMDAGQLLTPKQLLELIKQELERIGDDALTTTVRTACVGITDTARLNRFRLELATRQPKEEAQDNE